VLVDDDLEVLRALHRTLRREPLDVRATASAAQVLAWLKAGDVDLLVVDLRMPEMPGTELIALARKISPRTWCVLLSAHPEAAREAGRRHAFVERVLRKPWSDVELRTLVRTLAREAVSREGSEEPRTISCESRGDRDVLELARVRMELAKSRGEKGRLRLVEFARLQGSWTRLLKSLVLLADSYDMPVALSDDQGCVPVFLRTLGSAAPKVFADPSV
jgi:DNA-binding response OmpR family regulator